MKAALYCGVFLLALSAEAQASAYSDFNAGIAAHNDGDAAGTIRAMSLALAAPDLPVHLKPAALFDRADAYARSGEIDLALSDLSACLALAPENYAALVRRADIYLSKRSFDLARRDYIEAARIRPELPLAYAGRGTVDITERKYDDALGVLADGLARSPWSLDFYVLRSEAYRLSGRYDQAIREDETAIGRDADFADAYFARGKARQDFGDVATALADFHKAHDLNMDDGDLLFTMGVAEWELGRFEDAAHSFRRVPAGTRLSDYALLWSFLAGAKRNAVGAVAQEAAATDLKRWPGPIVKLIAGTSTAPDVLASAKDGDADARSAQTCEADFYVGEWQLYQGNRDEARRLLGEAGRVCGIEMVELGAVKAELKRMRWTA
jgi:tetratricopeptide (TPR) repeat protein